MPEGNGSPNGKLDVVAEAPTPAAAPKKLKRPVEEVRAELMTNEEVRKQARLLQLPLAEYVEKILDYAQNPEKPPQVYVLPDEALKARDPSIPTTDDIKGYMEKVVSGEIAISPAHQKDGYAEDTSRARYSAALGTAEAPKGAPEDASVSKNPKKGP
jgi:hypothetical protein